MAGLFGRLGDAWNMVRGTAHSAPVARNSVDALDARLAQANGVLERGIRRAGEALDDARDAYRASRRETLSHIREERAAHRAAGHADHPPTREERIRELVETRRGYRTAQAEHATTTRGLRESHRSIESSIDSQILRSAETGHSQSFLRRNWGKATIATLGAGAMALSSLGSIRVENLPWLARIAVSGVGNLGGRAELTGIQDIMFNQMMVNNDAGKTRTAEVLGAVFGDADPTLIRDPNYLNLLRENGFQGGSPDQQTVASLYINDVIARNTANQTDNAARRMQEAGAQFDQSIVDRYSQPAAPAAAPPAP
jgi:hypothetical protein